MYIASEIYKAFTIMSVLVPSVHIMVYNNIRTLLMTVLF